MSTLWLIRHPEPEAAADICYGSLDLKLSDSGVGQAHAIAAALSAQLFAAIYTSPLQRCRDTATILTAGRTCKLEEIDSLRELDHGEWEGMTYDAILACHPKLYDRWMHQPLQVQFPGGGCFMDMRDRVLAVAADLCQRHRNDDIALVTHAGPIRVLLADALGIPPSNIFRIGSSYGGVSAIQYVANVPVIEFMNWVIRASSASPRA